MNVPAATLSDSQALFQLGLIFVLAMGAQLLAPKLRVPAILLLLIVGFAAGVSGILDTDELLGDLISPIVSLATGIILFEGGLQLTFRGLEGESRRVVNLAITLGVAITWALGLVAAKFMFDLSWALATLVGAILIVSGPTVVGPLLDFIRPSRAIDTVLKWEGTLIDPIGAVLGVVTFQAVLNGTGTLGGVGEVVDFLVAIGVGIGFGVVGTLVLTGLARVVGLNAGNALPLALVVVLLVVTLADIVSDDSGLLATLIMGMVVANVYFDRARRSHTRGARIEFAKSVAGFTRGVGGVSTILIAMLFIILSSRVSVDDISALGPVVIGFVAVLILLVRPIAVAAWTWGSRLAPRERGFVAWMAPRGIIAAATSSSFAVSLEAANVAGADKIFPITFVVILGTAAVYGLTGKPMAAALGVARTGPQGVLLAGASTLVTRSARALAGVGVTAMVAPLGRELAQDEARAVQVYEGDVLTDIGSSTSTVLDEIGSVLLMTESDELNSILATDIAELGGRDRVYQLAPEEPDTMGRGSFFQRAPVLFDWAATHVELARRIEAGESIVATTVGEEGPPESAIPLFVLTPGKRLQIVTAEEPARPDAGEVLICLAPERETGGGES